MAPNGSCRSFPTSRKARMCSERRFVSPHCGFSGPVSPEKVHFAHEQGSETLLTSVAKTRALSRMSLAKAWRVREASHCLLRHRDYSSRTTTSIRNRNWRLGLGLWCEDGSLPTLEACSGRSRITRLAPGVVHRLPNLYLSSGVEHHHL